MTAAKIAPTGSHAVKAACQDEVCKEGELQRAETIAVKMLWRGRSVEVFN